MNRGFLTSTFSLYVLAILIWGSTWFAITLQIGTVPLLISVFYRFALASLLLFLFCYFRGVPLNFSGNRHFILFLNGATSYFLSYYLVYEAAALLPSGINAVLFSVLTVFNMLNASLVLKSPLTLRGLFGCTLGILGVGLIFLPDVLSFELKRETFIGAGLSILSAYISSWGNIFSEMNLKRGLSPLQINTFSMGYGALACFFLALIEGLPFSLELSFSYISSLVYLSTFGTIITFGCLLILIDRLGAYRASYPLLLVPLIALLISEIFEDFLWTLWSLFGVLLIFAGNYYVMTVRRAEKT